MRAPKHVVVDSENRVALAPLAAPGEVYRVETPESDQIVLRRLSSDVPRNRPSYEEALKAIRESALEFTIDYDNLRKLTREP